jgi:hypothetical protein
MFDAGDLGRALIALGVLIVIVGAALVFAGRLPIGRLPGDIAIEGNGFSCLFPLATSLLASIVLTIILNLIIRLLNR